MQSALNIWTELAHKCPLKHNCHCVASSNVDLEEDDAPFPSCVTQGRPMAQGMPNLFRRQQYKAAGCAAGQCDPHTVAICACAACFAPLASDSLWSVWPVPETCAKQGPFTAQNLNTETFQDTGKSVFNKILALFFISNNTSKHVFVCCALLSLLFSRSRLLFLPQVSD